MGLDSLFNDRSQLANKINVLSGNIGDKTLLNTTAKDSLVSATNELHDQFGNLSKNNVYLASYAKMDGTTDDSTAVLNAITDAANKTLVIPDDVTVYVTQQIVLSSPITINMGKNSTFKSGYVPADHNQGFIEISSSNVYLKDVSIDGQSNDHVGIRADIVSNVTIDGGTIKNVGILAGIRFETVTDSKILNATVKANKTNDGSASLGGIYCNNSSNIIVNKNTVTGFYGKGINFVQSSKSVISECIVHDLNTSYSDGIYVGYICLEVTVTNNKVYNTSGNGIKISRQAKKTVVSNNTISGNIGTGAWGILLQGALYCLVIGNKLEINGDVISIYNIDHPDPQGGSGLYNKITHNDIISQSTTKEVIRSEINATYTVSDTEISYNTINGGYIGIGAYSTRTKVIGNTVLGVSNFGISVRANADYSDVLDNTIQGNAGNNAIYVQFPAVKLGINVCRNRIINASYTAINTSNIAESNICENLLYGTNASGTIGINIGTGVTEVNVNQNIIDSFPISGVYCSTTASTNVNVCMNQVMNCAGNYLDIQATNGAVIGNTKKNSGALYLSAGMTSVGNAT